MRIGLTRSRAVLEHLVGDQSTEYDLATATVN